jgi:hypothetical protein
MASRDLGGPMTSRLRTGSGNDVDGRWSGIDAVDIGTIPCNRDSTACRYLLIYQLARLHPQRHCVLQAPDQYARSAAINIALDGEASSCRFHTCIHLAFPGQCRSHASLARCKLERIDQVSEGPSSTARGRSMGFCRGRG